MNFWRVWMFVLVVGLAGCADKPKRGVDGPAPVAGENKSTTEEQAIAEIQKLGGTVLPMSHGLPIFREPGPKLPTALEGAPEIIVNLGDTQVTNAGLEYLGVLTSVRRKSGRSAVEDE